VRRMSLPVAVSLNRFATDFFVFCIGDYEPAVLPPFRKRSPDAADRAAARRSQKSGRQQGRFTDCAATAHRLLAFGSNSDEPRWKRTPGGRNMTQATPFCRFCGLLSRKTVLREGNPPRQNAALRPENRL
jgi:hypothetical protein